MQKFQRHHQHACHRRNVYINLDFFLSKLRLSCMQETMDVGAIIIVTEKYSRLLDAIRITIQQAR